MRKIVLVLTRVRKIVLVLTRVPLKSCKSTHGHEVEGRWATVTAEKRFKELLR